MSLAKCLVLLLWLPLVIADNVADSRYDPSDPEAWETRFGSYPYQTFRSDNFTAPVVRTPVKSSQCHDDRYVFLSPRGDKVEHPSVMILDNQGELVWQNYVRGQPYNLQVQEYKGEKVLTFWVGDDAVGGHGEGVYHIYDSKYQEVAKVSGTDGARPDLHEFTITPEGTALITIYQIGAVKQPGILRFANTVWIWDCLVQEINLSTNSVLFEWRASEHHTLNESYYPLAGAGYTAENPYDYFHVNSVQKDDLGNYLISARFTSTVTYVDGKTGEILWVLGGKRNGFHDLSTGPEKATNMAYQHYARFHSLETFPKFPAKGGRRGDERGVTRRLLTAFDNVEDKEVETRPSRGVLIELTYPATAPASASASTPSLYTARLLQSYTHPSAFVASSQGSLQVIPQNASDPHILIGYGRVGAWAEFSADGKLLCDVRFSTEASFGTGHVQSYSVLKAFWQGRPVHPPAVVASPAADEGAWRVSVSWNGATEVRGWKLQTRRTERDGWADAATVEKRGFETETTIEAVPQRGFVRAVALDAEGGELGSASAELRVKDHGAGLRGSLLAAAAALALIALVLGRRKVKRLLSRDKGSGQAYEMLPNEPGKHV